jgi:hypothetical protein
MHTFNQLRSLIFCSIVCGVLLIAILLLRSASLGPGHDLDTLPTEMMPVIDRIGQLPDGKDGYTDLDWLIVDKDRHMWIEPGRFLCMPTSSWMFDGCQNSPIYRLHIMREGEYIIVFKNSMADRAYAPGSDVPQNAIPVKLR